MADPPDDVSAPRDATPSVLAVVVAHRPEEWFEETLESLATQDYQRLDVLVVDAAGDPALAGRVKKHLPRASVLDAADTEGFSAAADAVLDTEMDPAFLLICHDDIALAPDAVRQLVVEALRSNAGVAGPKLVHWDAPDRLQHVAYVVDRFAAQDEVVEPRELDQEQYDAVADVTAIPSACLLIRTALFRTLHGFDPEMTFRGEDVDLCWRAQLAGSRVLIVPAARVRHREDLVGRTGVDDVRRTRARHRLRTVMVTGGRLGLLLTLPLAALLTLGEAILALVTGRFSHVSDVLGAWVWNARRLGQIRRRRRELRAITRARHADLRALQETGSVRINAFIRGQIGRDTFGRAGHELASAVRTGTMRFAVLGWALVVLFVVFGSRKMLTDGVPALGDFVAFPGSSGDLWSEWWSGWRDRDLGAPAAGSGALAVTAVVAAVLGNAVGLARTLWVLAPVVIGFVGAWRMLSVTGSRRAQLGSLVAYVIVPLPWAALATASIPGLYAYAAAPWVIAGFLQAQARPPFRSARGAARSLASAGAGLGITLGLAAAFEPATVYVALPVVVGLVVAGLLTADPGGIPRLGAAAGIAVVVGGALAFPLVIDLLSSAPTWDPFSGGHDGGATTRPLTDLLRFAVGPDEADPLWWALVVPFAFPLVIGRSWRFGVGVRGWAIALVSWAVAWASAWGALPFGMPDEPLLLAPAAAGLALVSGAGVAAVEHDLRGARFGWRQALLPVSIVAVAVASLPTLALAETGRWGLPRGDFDSVVPFADPLDDGSYRVLWIAAPEFVPGDGRPLVSGLAWSATLDGLPTVSDRGPAPDDGAAPLLEGVLKRALDGDTMRLGRELGGLGVRYIVMLERLGPAPFSAPEDAVVLPDLLTDTMAAQLDLQRLEGVNSAMVVYVNTEWTSVRAAAPPDFDEGRTSLRDLGRNPVSGTAGVLPGDGDALTGLVPDGAVVYLAQTPDAGWRLDVEGDRAAVRRALDWATVFLPESGGDAELSYATPLGRRVTQMVQLLALIAVLGLAVRRLVGVAR